MIDPAYFISLSAVMFTAGLFGVLTQKNAVRIIISVEIMLNAANVSFIGFNSIFGWGHFSGAAMALFVIGIAAAEAAIGLAILLSVNRSFGEITISNIFSLREQELN